MSVATSVCVLNLHFRGHKYSPVPNWIKRVLLIKTIEDNGINQIKLRRIKKEIRANSRPQGGLHATFNASSRNFSCMNGQNISMSSKAKYKMAKIISSKVENGEISKCFESSTNNSNSAIIPNSEHTHRNRRKMLSKSDPQYEVSLQSEMSNNILDENSRNNCKSHIDMNMEKILKITKWCAELYERNYFKTVTKQLVSDEWKYVAARFDFFLFIFALFVVVTTPILLFSKYWRRQLDMDAKCGCENHH